MEVTWTEADDGVVIGRIVGRLNMASAPELDAAFASVLVGGWKKIALDLSGIDFLDSSGLGAIVAGMRIARTEGADVRVANPSWQASMVLKLTNMDHILQIHPDVEKAFADA